MITLQCDILIFEAILAITRFQFEVSNYNLFKKKSHRSNRVFFNLITES